MNNLFKLKIFFLKRLSVFSNEDDNGALMQ